MCTHMSEEQRRISNERDDKLSEAGVYIRIHRENFMQGTFGLATTDQVYDLLARVHHLVKIGVQTRKKENQMPQVLEKERQEAVQYFLEKESVIERPNPEVRRFTSGKFGGRVLLTVFQSKRKAREFQLFLTGLTPANSMRLKAGEWKATSQVLDRKRKRGGKGAGGGAGAGWNSNG